MSAPAAHQVLGRMDPDAFARALKRADALARGELADVTDDELPLLRYLAAVQRQLDAVRSRGLAASTVAALNPA